MQHHPIGTFDWQHKVAKADLPLTTKAVAMFLAHFANADGSRVHPGEKKLAKILDLTERAVRSHLAKLREIGLIERVEHGQWADVYQLTLPGGAVDTVPMRMDKNWQMLKPAVPKRRRAATGTPDPVDEHVNDVVDRAVDNAGDRKPGSGSEDSGAQGHRKPGAAVPETGSASTGTPVPPTNPTNPHQPISGLPQVATSLDAVGEDDQGEVLASGGFEPDEAEYAAANEILMALGGKVEPFMTEAIAELAAAGIADPSARQIAVRAADFATRPAVPDPGSVHRVRSGRLQGGSASRP
ncbi:hypothetical protein GCM10009839_13570 [Catenulispora yoronensis]|uniref:Helix-turn-helix domain-containing protein n=1 Tax=Catenulispora yoronensis TaxID=450799 RepID=A0ABP5FBN1_9ACTN